MSDSPSTPAPRVSVVIAAYKAEKFLPATLESIQAQTLPDWECIVVEDGSPDQTLAVAQRCAAADSRIRVFSQANQGPSVARNLGLGLLNPGSKYVTVMDGDDLWMPDMLETLVREIEAHPEAVGAQALGRCVDVHGVEIEDPAYSSHGNGRYVCNALGSPVQLEASALTSFRSLWFSTPFPPGLIVARRAAYEKTGGFDTDIRPVEDWDMLIRLSREGGFCFVNRVLLSYRRHGNNTSVTDGGKTLEKIRQIWHKTFFAPENNAEQKKVVRKNWRTMQLHHTRQKLGSAASHFSRARLGKAAFDLASAAVHLYRLARGYPTLRGL